MNTDLYPRKRMAAGALVRDEAQRLLIVKPTYRPDWLIPGGVVEFNESPKAACTREIEEELGLRIAVGRLLCVDYRPADEGTTESLQWIFDGGVLDATQIAQIRLPPDELERFLFLPPDEALPMLNTHLHRRMAQALVALRDGEMLYLEEGRVPG